MLIVLNRFIDEEKNIKDKFIAINVNDIEYVLDDTYNKYSRLVKKDNSVIKVTESATEIAKSINRMLSTTIR